MQSSSVGSKSEAADSSSKPQSHDTVTVVRNTLCYTESCSVRCGAHCVYRTYRRRLFLPVFPRGKLATSSDCWIDADAEKHHPQDIFFCEAVR